MFYTLSFRVGVDVGGTFTDLVALNNETGELMNIKVPTVTKKISEGVADALKEFLNLKGSIKISLLIHATTIATNAIIGQLGLELPKTVLITTKGFKDVIEIGRQNRPELYNLFVEKPKPLIPRRYRFEVSERIGAKGEIIEPLNKQELGEIVSKIMKEGISTIAIGLLNSYINPKHEREIEEFLKKKIRNIFISPSYKVSPEYREYERFSSTVVNAVLRPIVSVYIDELIEEIKRVMGEIGFYIMQSNGGMASASSVSMKPISIIESGPAAGVVAAAYYGELLGLKNILSFDMGGTTAKAGIIIENRPMLTHEYEVGGRVHKGRIVKGSGYPVRFPFVDLAECSAGGGTIAWVDEGGALRVGPLSAGADPGPACYGKGGENPTVTDANLIIGRLNPNYLLNGKMKIYRELAEKTLKSKICEETGLDVEEAAIGIIEIANSEMAKILRIVSVERGNDPRIFSMVAFGGAGPMHACPLAEELEISRIIIPLNPGLFSALGLLTSDLSYSFSKAVMEKISEVEPEKLEEIFTEMEEKGRELLAREGIPEEKMVYLRKTDARYLGQSYELTVSVPKPITEKNLESVKNYFHKRHKAVYGYSVEEEEVELVNARLTAIGKLGKPKLKEKNSIVNRRVNVQPEMKRPVFFEGTEEYLDCPIYLREKLPPGFSLEGPAIFEQYDTTTVIYPKWEAKIDKFGNVILNLVG